MCDLSLNWRHRQDGKMPTLILTPRYSDDAQILWKAATQLAWRVERLSNWRIPASLCDLDEPVLYGEALFGPALAEQLGLTLLNPAEDWLVRLPFEFKLRQIVMTTLGAARGSLAAAFVKPPNDKSFPAAVYRGRDLPIEFDDAMAVLVSEVVTWEKEFRCFILHRKLQTFSIYARYGTLQDDAQFASTTQEDQEMQQFLDQVLADHRVDLPTACVLDVGKIVGAGWACVEQNAAWGAGIYGCQPAAVLDVLRHAAIRAE